MVSEFRHTEDGENTEFTSELTLSHFKSTNPSAPQRTFTIQRCQITHQCFHITEPETVLRPRCQITFNNKRLWNGWGRMVTQWGDRWRGAKRSESISYWWKVIGSQNGQAGSDRQVITLERASLLTEKGFRLTEAKSFLNLLPLAKGESDAGGGSSWWNVPARTQPGDASTFRDTRTPMTWEAQLRCLMVFVLILCSTKRRREDNDDEEQTKEIPVCAAVVRQGWGNEPWSAH